MDISDYIQRLQKSHGIRDLENLGISDNWRILLNSGNMKEILDHFNQSEDYSPSPSNSGYRHIAWESKTGVIAKLSKFNPELPLFSLDVVLLNTNYFQSVNYNMQLQLGNAGKDIQKLSPLIVDIGNFLVTNDIPSCFPDTLGKGRDYGSIAYRGPRLIIFLKAEHKVLFVENNAMIYKLSVSVNKLSREKCFFIEPF